MVKAWIPYKLYGRVRELVRDGEYEDISAVLEHGLHIIVEKVEEEKQLAQLNIAPSPSPSVSAQTDASNASREQTLAPTELNPSPCGNAPEELNAREESDPGQEDR